MRGEDTALDLAELAGGVVEVWAGPGQPPPPQLCLRGPGRVRSPCPAAADTCAHVACAPEAVP